MFVKALPAAVILCSGLAFAQTHRQVQFEYERQDGASACPEITSIRAGVAARLGYEPFSDQAEDRLRATMRRSGRVLEARIEMTDTQGNLKAERRLVSRQGDCAELASSVELALSIAIDPFHTRAQPVVAAPPPKQAAPLYENLPAEPAGPAPRVPSEPSPPISGTVEVGVIVGIGSAPSRTLGARAGAGIRRGQLSLGIEGRADLPASVPLRVGDASTSLLVGSLVPCVHFRMVAGCALATAGALRAAGHGLVDSKQVTVPYLAMGARLRFAYPLTANLALALHGDLTAPLTETELLVDDVGIWTSPAISFALGLGVAAHFP